MVISTKRIDERLFYGLQGKLNENQLPQDFPVPEDLQEKLVAARRRAEELDKKLESMVSKM
jgi:hypothetical protein